MLGEAEEFVRHARARGSREMTIVLLSKEGNPEEQSPEEQAFMRNFRHLQRQELLEHYAHHSLIATIRGKSTGRFEIRQVDAKFGLFMLLDITTDPQEEGESVAAAALMFKPDRQCIDAQLLRVGLLGHEQIAASPFCLPRAARFGGLAALPHRVVDGTVVRGRISARPTSSDG